MVINSEFVLKFYDIVCKIYDFFSSVFTFFLDNTVTSAFATLFGEIYILLEGTFIGEAISLVMDVLYVYLIKGTFIGEMNMLLFTLTTCITISCAVGFAKFFAIKDV